MTSFQTVYDAFLAKMLDDEWGYWEEADIKDDWKAMLKGALPWFKFPRVSLEIGIDDETGEECFTDELNNEEI